jgi:two-component system, NarL family, nitrate/nitrite response regulator NarL
VQAVRALVVDDHPVFRRGLRSLLDGEPWVDRVDEAATVREAVDIAAHTDVGVIAMDVRLPDGNGIDATARILEQHPGIAVLLLTMSGEEDLVRRGLRAGAKGYLLKDSDPEAVVDALRAVCGGGLVLGPRVPTTVLAAAGGPPAPFDRLTPRECVLAEHIAAGRTNIQIARALGVSDKTVRNAVSALLAKLSVPDRLAVALLARDVGLTR